MGNALYKVVFTKSGQTTRAYGCDTTNRILRMTHPEQEWSQKADILVDNREGNLTALDLTGYTSTISYGYFTGVARTAWAASTVYAVGTYVIPTTANVNGYQYKCTTAGTSHTAEPTWGTAIGGTTTESTGVVWTLDGNDGDEYSACAPLEVISQQGVTDLNNGDLLTYFSAIGVFDFMGKDEASATYTLESSDVQTVKTLLTAIANATMSCFSHCKNYTITYDSEDSLIDSFKPADSFSVGFKESRLSAFKRALGWTKCRARIENTSGVATIHVFDISANTAPHYISGTTYNYEYNDAVTNHNFFEKSVRNRLIIPNRVYVKSHQDQGTYTGNATDATSYAALGRYIDEFNQLRVTSNSQCTAIATAIMQGYQLGYERGHGSAPLNCGQEVMDYVKITDSVASDTRTGNIGYLKRDVAPGKFDFEFRFGDIAVGGLPSFLPSSAADLTMSLSDRVSFLMEGYESLADFYSRLLSMTETNAANIKTMWDYLMNGGDDVWFKKLTVTEIMKIPGWDV